MASGLLVDYLGHGDVADRPATPTLFLGSIGLWWSDDTDTLSVWDGVTWNDVSGGGGGGASWGSITGTLSSQTDLAAALAAKAPLAASVQSVTSASTITPTASNDMVKVTALAVNTTLANPSGSPSEGWGWVFRIKDNGTARTISYGDQYRAIGLALPTATVIGKTLYLAAIWNATDTKVDVVAVGQEA